MVTNLVPVANISRRFARNSHALKLFGRPACPRLRTHSRGPQHHCTLSKRSDVTSSSTVEESFMAFEHPVSSTTTMT